MSENQQPLGGDKLPAEPRLPQDQPLPDYYAEPASGDRAPSGSSAGFSQPLEAAPDPRLEQAFAQVRDSEHPAYEPTIVSNSSPEDEQSAPRGWAAGPVIPESVNTETTSVAADSLSPATSSSPSPAPASAAATSAEPTSAEPTSAAPSSPSPFTAERLDASANAVEDQQQSSDSLDIPTLEPAGPESSRAPLSSSIPLGASAAVAGAAGTGATGTGATGATATHTDAEGPRAPRRTSAEPAVTQTQVIPAQPAVSAASPATSEAGLPSRRQARLAHKVAATGPSLWEHLVGTLLGIILAALGLLTIGLGAARISELNADGITVDNLGIVFVGLGAVIVAAIISLGLWTAAVPITAGIITSAAGGLLLFAPQIGADVVNEFLRNNSNAVTIDRLIADGNAGWFFILGILLLVTGIVNSTLKRRVRRVATMLISE